MSEQAGERPARAPRSSLLPLFLLSGACDLIYEIAWGRALGLVFGVSVFAITAVLASFMLGLAVGGTGAARLARAIPNPGLLFSRLHTGIAISAAATVLLLPVVRTAYLAASGLVDPESWGLRPVVLVLSVLLLIVPTALMGATFPVACRIVEPAAARMGRDVGSLYAAGTAGSILGCVVAVVALPLAGLKGTIALAALVDVAVGFVALRLWADEDAGAL